jgi:hypothetical protein
MLIEELVSLNFDKMIDFSYNPLKDTLKKIVKMIEQHHIVYDKIRQDNSFFDSTE